MLTGSITSMFSLPPYMAHQGCAVHVTTSATTAVLTGGGALVVLNSPQKTS